MRRLLLALLAAALLGGAGLAVWQVIAERRPLARVFLGGPARFDIPDSPDEWRGRVDYRALDRNLRTLVQRPEMAGLAVAVVENGELRFVGTYGTADRASGAPVTPETLFRWASVSKTATGMLAAKLADEGALRLDRPLTSWPTSLRLPDGAETRLTLAQLLAQQSGLTKNAYDEKLEDGQDPAALRASMVGAPQQCPPGTCYTYQNIAFDAASEILADAAGTSFAEAVTARLFQPLGMTSAGFGMEQFSSAKSWAKPHNLATVQPLKEAYWRVPAAAGVDSNIIDFSVWMQAAMGMRPEVLPAPVRELAMVPRVKTGRPFSGELARALSNAGYGLGWRRFAYRGRMVAGHSGAVAGYRATMIFEPRSRTGVVAMWNSNWGIPFRIPFAVLDSYHRETESNWFDLSAIPLPGAPPAPTAARAKLPAAPPAPLPATPDKSRSRPAS